jgi:hypothetical protein
MLQTAKNPLKNDCLAKVSLLPHGRLSLMVNYVGNAPLMAVTVLDEEISTKYDQNIFSN